MAFAGAVLGGWLGFSFHGPIGLICGMALGAAYGLAEPPRPD
jgi:hypothetical protein